jgi:vancomycin permeability regulator SanA
MLIATIGPAAAAWLPFQSNIYDSMSDVPESPVAIVLGAGVNPDGTLSPMLADRVQAGVDLYFAGTVSRLLMSGDNSTEHYDEVTAMRRYAIAKGVPPELVNLDYAGFRTYDTCVRAVKVFGIRRAVMVSQRYHLARAVYTARSVGIDAAGYVAGRNHYAGQEIYDVREAASLVVAWYELNVLHPDPRYLGDPIDLETQFAG